MKEEKKKKLPYLLLEDNTMNMYFKVVTLDVCSSQWGL